MGILQRIADLLTGKAAGSENKGTKTPAVVHLATQDFKERVYDYVEHPEAFVYKGTTPAVVDFYATWCGPCQVMGGVITELGKEYEGRVTFYKVDVDMAGEVARTFGIRSVPTLLFIPTNGDQPLMVPGAMTKADMKRMIEGMMG